METPSDNILLKPKTKITGIVILDPKDDDIIANIVRTPSVPPYIIDFKWSDKVKTFFYKDFYYFYDKDF